MSKIGRIAQTSVTTALLLGVGIGHATADAHCDLINGIMPADCALPNQGIVVNMPATANTEMERGSAPLSPSGFLFSINGETQSGDPRVEDLVRRTDIGLSDANIQVKFDGLGVQPRLDLEMLESAGPRADGRVTFKAFSNYPAFVTRGELRLMQWDGSGTPRTLSVVPLAPNLATAVKVPEGNDIVVTYRVYDAQGRYDETQMRPVSTATGVAQDGDGEEGSDATARRRIPVTGGAVTVFGSDVKTGTVVRTLGESIEPDASGNFVIQRILPAGDQNISVRIDGAGQDGAFDRTIFIPRSEWFHVATADLTFGSRLKTTGTYWTGRFAFYVNGKTENGWEITASADTREGDLDTLFRDLDKKDPRHLLMRIDPDMGYPVYGDDSRIEEDAPTSGKFYLRAEKAGNHLMWGNFAAGLAGSHYLRNDRVLYGAQGFYASPATTAQGDARFTATAYAAQPDNLPGRDTFLGTGGSIYFLNRQDISIGSETLAIEIRDRTTGRVISRQDLVYGRDYDINYLQGIITLASPLTSGTGAGSVVTSPSGTNEVHLVAQYEFTPTTGDVDGFALGGRAQVWATDRLRFGVTQLVEQTGIADQTAVGADLRYQFSEGTFVDLEIARTSGPGFGFTSSTDGGLSINNTFAVGGTGRAYRVAGEADFADLRLGSEGRLGGYFEDRTTGFSTLDYQTAADETLWGVFAEGAPSDRLSWSLKYDSISDDTGHIDRTGGASISLSPDEISTWTLGVENLNKVTIGDAANTGDRTDVALRYSRALGGDQEWFAYVQGTADVTGGLSRNDRLGLGGRFRLSENWLVEAEVSEGTLGTGANLIFTHGDGAKDSTYFGYTLEPGRELSGVTLAGADRGRFVAGANRQISDDLNMFGENTFDLFGEHRALTSVYGVNYAPNDFLNYSGTLEMGRVTDPTGDVDRTALSFGVAYADQKGMTARGRIELRQDRGVSGGVPSDLDAVLVSGTVRYKVDEERRWLFNLESSNTSGSATSILNGQYTDVTLGYAYRPIKNDRLNLLFGYEYLYDMVGQQVDGSNVQGPRQQSHVLSLDASYDIDPQWTVGGKLGARISNSSPAAGVAFSQNDAWLAVMNVRFHATHKWDLLLETRALNAKQAGFTEIGVTGAAYRHLGNNLKLGVGHNFGTVSDSLTDLTQDDSGPFLNLVAKF